jgi:excisionase family DNA binding protein
MVMLEIGGHKLYNVQELTKKLDVTKLTIRTYIKQGKLSARKIGGKWYVTEEELISFLSLTDRSKEAQV